MNNDIRILKYLDNQLTPEEKNKFELELSISAELKMELEKFQAVNLKINKVKQIDTDRLYLNSLVSRFRKKLESNEKGSSFRKLAFVASITVFIIGSFIFYNALYDTLNENNNLIKFTNSLSDEEKIELLKNIETQDYDFSFEYSNLDFENYKTDLRESLSITEDKEQVADLYNIEIEQPADFISEQEFEKIYNEILTMNFFEKENL